MQSREQKIPAPVSRKNPTRPIRPMRPRRQPYDPDPRLRIPKPRHRLSPILPIQIRPPLLLRHLLAIRHQSRTPPAPLNLRRQQTQRIPLTHSTLSIRAVAAADSPPPRPPGPRSENRSAAPSKPPSISPPPKYSTPNNEAYRSPPQSPPDTLPTSAKPPPPRLVAIATNRSPPAPPTRFYVAASISPSPCSDVATEIPPPSPKPRWEDAPPEPPNSSYSSSAPQAQAPETPPPDTAPKAPRQSIIANSPYSCSR